MDTRARIFLIFRPPALVMFYVLTLSISLWVSYLLRFDFNPPREYLGHYDKILMGTLGIKLLLLLIFGQFGSLLTYFGLYDLGKILGAMTLAALVAYLTWLAGGVTYAPPRAVILTDFLLSVLMLSGLRVGFRMVREGMFDGKLPANLHRHVGIVGAGDVGAALVRDLQNRRGLGMIPKVFFDDSRVKWDTTIHGISVYGSPETISEYLRHHRLDEIIIAMPSASARRIRQVVSLLQQLQLRFEIVPSYEQLVTGKVRVSQLRSVEIQDLLGREPVNLETERIRDLIQGSVVLVTGAGGTIGGELCRQIAGHGARKLLLVERSEFLLFQVEQELKQLGYNTEIVPLVADVLDEERMRKIFAEFSPTILFHAAAHKHVPMMENQPAEALRNNAIGTMRLAELAVAHQVDRFVFISTDKAINPTNVMGASKRMAELCLQAYQRHNGTKTKFMAVRFGNVLGSSGSVIPTFKRQIAAGGPVTVTHPEVTRYFMTVNEAVGLVLQSATLGEGGEIFVLDMGQPMKIVDLARQLIELSGLQPDVDIEIQFTGLRPGEKLYEELNHQTENHVATEHPRIMRFVSEAATLDEIRTKLMGLHHESVAGVDPAELKQKFRRLVPEYVPYLGPN